MVDYNAATHRHRFTPLADIQRLAGYAGHPLFDTVFMYQKSPSRDSGFKWAVVSETAAVDYIASMELEANQEDEITLRLTFNTSRIPHQHASLMLQQYDLLLAQLVGNVSRYPQSNYSILPAQEPCLPSASEFLHELVERGAKQHPDRVALLFIHDHLDAESTAKSWTYKELNERGNQVAHLLRKFGVHSGSIVAVAMDKCPEASFAFVGILKAGCSFLAIDPELPASRLEFILRDSGSSFLFVNDKRKFSANLADVPLFELRESPLANFRSSSVSSSRATPDANCYCLYTSGTTGTPKGCEISHENAVQAMMAFQRLFAGHWTAESRWLQFASYWFDVSVLEQFCSWGVGITVVGAPRDVVLEDLSGFLRKHEITHIDLTPSLARLLKPEDAPSLCDGVFITGGEALKQEIIDTWGPKGAICNGYGPTEATIGVTMNTFIGADAKPSNIGHQFDNVGAYVLQPGSDEPVLRGAVGELCVSGKLVGKGYLNRPELTERHFPFLLRFGERVYRTGDLVRALADGSFAFVGRQDSQAKLRGQRLEISEIDSVIQQCGGDIAHVVSLVIKSDDGGRDTLVSFFTINAQSKGDHLEIDASEQSRRLVTVANEACSSRLPSYMVPMHILPISFLPLTVNNKVDTKRLASLFTSCSPRDLQGLSNYDGESYETTLTEQRLCTAVSNMLQVSPQEVTRRSNLFSLGLSSISAISLSSLLKRSGFTEASVATVLSNPTLGQLSAALDNGGHSQQEEHDAIEQAKLKMKAFDQRYRSIAARALCLNVEQIEIVAPCTSLQQGLILDSLRNGDRPYFNDFRYDLNNINTEHLETSLQTLVDRAQVLRTKFINTDEGYAQAVLSRMPVQVFKWSVPAERLDVSLSKKKAQWMEKNEQDLGHPFEVHIASSPTTTVLSLYIHHALYDGISYDLMIEDLMKIYKSKSTLDSRPSFISALAYGPLRETRQAETFWKKRLEGCQNIPLPPLEDAAENDILLKRPVRDTAGLESIRKELGVSHQALLQTCFEIGLRLCAPTVKMYGIVVSGRSIELTGADRVCGPMFNTLPQPLHKASGSTLSEHVRRCHSMNIETLPFQHTPLRDIRKWCARDPFDSMFDALFVFQHKPKSELAGRDELLMPSERMSRAHYPIACEVEFNNDGEISISVLAQGRYFTRRQAQNFLDSFNEAFDCVLHDRNASLGDKFDITTDSGTPQVQNSYDNMTYVNGVTSFEWTSSAKAIRQEISSLVGSNVNDIDEHTTIFALGLDSIDAVKLSSRFKKKGIAIAVSKILQAQTIPRMVKMIQDSSTLIESGTDYRKLQPITKQLERLNFSPVLSDAQQIERVLPATPNQEALIADMYRSELREYFNHDVLYLRPNTDVDRLKSAWQIVVDSSPILRTSFVEVSAPEVQTVIAQVVYQSKQLEFGKRRVQHLDEINDIFEGIRQEGLANVRKVSPLRLTFVTVDSERYLILSLSHAQYDGHSLALLHEDVQRAYSDSFELRPPYDEAVEASLAAVDEESKRFWTDALSGATIRAFPCNNTKGQESRTHRAETQSKVSSTIARSLCQNNGVSMQALAQTCWALTLAHYTQSTEVIFGVVLACRDSERAEEIMFPTMNTVAMRSSLHGSRSQFLRYTQSMITDMIPYQRTPLRTIQAARAKVVQRDSSTAYQGLFDTLFVYQHKPAPGKLELSPLYDSVDSSSSVEYPVAVEMEILDDTIVIRGACKDIVTDERGTAQLLDIFDDVLQALVAAPDEPTVEFEGSMVSICGLEQVHLRPSDQEDGLEREGAIEENTKADAVLPATSLILEALAQVSRLPPTEISPTSTIEGIGIDSISAIKVSALLRKQSISLSVSEIIKAKTAVRMAAFVETESERPAREDKSSSDTISTIGKDRITEDLLAKVGIDVNNVEAAMPATSGQVYMLSMWQKTDGQLFYPTFSYQLETTLGLEEIKEAWNELVAHRPVLRTVFCKTGDAALPVLQIILRIAPDSFRHEGEGVISRQPMSSLQARKNDGGYTINLTIHHALYDAVSLPFLIQDLQPLLAGEALSTRELKYEEFIALAATPQAWDERKQFWSQYLQDTRPMRLSQPKSDAAQKRVEIFKPALFSQAGDLESIARREDLSIQVLLFAAYAKLYASLAGQHCSAEVDQDSADVVIGIYLSNRSHLPGLEDLAAPTLNLVPLLVRSPQKTSLLAVARQLQVDLQEIGIPERSGVGLWEIAEWTGVKVDTFVNFLKLPGRSGNDDRDAGAEEGNVVIRELDGRRLQERHQVVEASDKSFDLPQELRNLKGLDAYQVCYDVFTSNLVRRANI